MKIDGLNVLIGKSQTLSLLPDLQLEEGRQVVAKLIDLTAGEALLEIAGRSLAAKIEGNLPKLTPGSLLSLRVNSDTQGRIVLKVVHLTPPEQAPVDLRVALHGTGSPPPEATASPSATASLGATGTPQPASPQSAAAGDSAITQEIIAALVANDLPPQPENVAKIARFLQIFASKYQLPLDPKAVAFALAQKLPVNSGSLLTAWLLQDSALRDLLWNNLQEEGSGEPEIARFIASFVLDMAEDADALTSRLQRVVSQPTAQEPADAAVKGQARQADSAPPAPGRPNPPDGAVKGQANQAAPATGRQESQTAGAAGIPNQKDPAAGSPTTSIIPEHLGQPMERQPDASGAGAPVRPKAAAFAQQPMAGAPEPHPQDGAVKGQANQGAPATGGRFNPPDAMPAPATGRQESQTAGAAGIPNQKDPAAGSPITSIIPGHRGQPMEHQSDGSGAGAPETSNSLTGPQEDAIPPAHLSDGGRPARARISDAGKDVPALPRVQHERENPLNRQMDQNRPVAVNHEHLPENDAAGGRISSKGAVLKSGPEGQLTPPLNPSGPEAFIDGDHPGRNEATAALKVKSLLEQNIALQKATQPHGAGELYNLAPLVVRDFGNNLHETILEWRSQPRQGSGAEPAQYVTMTIPTENMGEIRLLLALEGGTRVHFRVSSAEVRQFLTEHCALLQEMIGRTAAVSVSMAETSLPEPQWNGVDIRI